MFANLIYFIVALIVYTAYQPSAETDFSAFEAVAFFLAILFGFSALTRIMFQRIEAKISRVSVSVSDRRFHALLARLPIVAIFLFFIDIYLLQLPSFLERFLLFRLFPTLAALIFVGGFIVYLLIIWACAWNVYRKLYSGSVSRQDYILSQLSFSLPVLIPWFLLSAVIDLIGALPFDGLKRFLSTPLGEIGYFLFFIVAIIIAGPVLIQKVWRCKPLEPGYHRWRIEHLCRKAGVTYAEILRWPILGGVTMTAAVMGLVGRFRYILISPALLHFMEPQEIDAVIAHESGHVKKKHLWLYLLFFGGYIALFYALFDLIVCLAFYSDPVYRLIEFSGLKSGTVYASLLGILLIGLLLIYFRCFFGYVMRNFERQADLHVYALLDNARPLISAFRKIAAASGQSADQPNWHHFSIKERIDYLEKCEADPSWITRHHRKIHRTIAAYLLALAATGLIGYQLNHGSAGQPLRQYCTNRIILKTLENTPDQKNRFRLMGDLYYSLKNYERAMTAYEQAIDMHPDDAEALNNLAWLYATCEAQALRRPKRALMLARSAAALQPSSAHILDTLAESCFVNGLYAEAVAAASRALALAAENRAYYEKQFARFSRVLQKGNSRF